ncbi:MAG: hypothetical protein ACR2HN_02325 [Tepidiformaceae bacterium]
MKRSTLIGLAIAAASLLAIPGAALGGLAWPSWGGSAEAQSPPPGLIMVVYGDVAGATVGQTVTALITVGGATTNCGDGVVIESGGPKYVVQVLADSQRAGCGVNGRTVRFSLSAPGQGPRLASQTVTFEAGKGKLLNLTLGQALGIQARLPLVARDNP